MKEEEKKREREDPRIPCFHFTLEPRRKKKKREGEGLQGIEAEIQKGNTNYLISSQISSQIKSRFKSSRQKSPF